MAESPSHRFGQIIGNLLEEIILPVLLGFCEDRGLYLDRHGERKNVRSGQKVSWEDKYGNTHDLDFVIEKEGLPDKQGRPVAFIEAAWRRYTKHARNKAQEIQGAVLPIAEKYERDKPFLGAVLAGVFTKGSLDQLKSVGFEVLYLPYETIVDAFNSVSIDTRFDEQTSDQTYTVCVEKIERLSSSKRSELKQHLLAKNKIEFDDFFVKLRQKLDRIIARIIVLPLFGNSTTFPTVDEAVSFIDGFDGDRAAGIFHKYELVIVYSNGDEIKGMFSSKERAKEFLKYIYS